MIDDAVDGDDDETISRLFRLQMQQRFIVKGRIRLTAIRYITSSTPFIDQGRSSSYLPPEMGCSG